MYDSNQMTLCERKNYRNSKKSYTTRNEGRKEG